MTIYGGSHTSFDAGSFGAGAVTGSTAIAAALVQGARNAINAAREANMIRWENWTREQLEVALNLSEGLRQHQCERVETLQRDNDRLRRVVQRLTVRPARAR